MPAKAFIDTNIVIYALGPNSANECARADEIRAEPPTFW